MPLIRIPLALHEHAAAELDAIAAEQHVTRTEAVRRAIAMYRWFITQVQAGNTMAVISPDGKVTPKEFVILT